MTKIITCSELRYRTLDEREALFRTLQIEFWRTAPGSRERAIVLPPRVTEAQRSGSTPASALAPASSARSCSASRSTNLAVPRRSSRGY